MAHHKSAKKRIRVTERKSAFNKTAISKIKTLVKKVYNSEDKAEAEALYKEAVSSLDKSVSKGRLHRNTVARKKAALTKYVNELSASEQSAPAEKA
jgi:small subunit ribosomal protein S20